MSGSRKASTSPFVVIVVLLVLIGAGVVAYFVQDRWLAVGPVVVAPGGVELRDRATSERLVEARNLSLAYLENKDFGKAEALLLELDRELPEERFGLRNLAVSQELALQQIAPSNAAELQGQGDKVLATLGRLGEREADSGVAELLRSRVLRKLGRLPEALAAAQTAADREPTQADYWYEIGMVAEEQGDTAARTEALRKAYELAPDNLFLMKDWLPLLARNQDASIVDAIARYREGLKPFAETIKAHSRIDVLQFLTDAETAAKAGNWPGVTGKVGGVSNVVKREAVAQADRLRLNRHSLEFVVLDFSPETLATLESAPQTEVPIPVSFEAWPLTAPSLPGVRDLVSLDWNLDGRTDLAVLSERKLSILTPADGAWTELASLDLPRAYAGMLAADLDDDVELPAAGEPPLPPGRCHQADPDFVLYGPEGLLLVESFKADAMSPRSLRLSAQSAGWEALTGITAAVLIDFDHEGDLDVIAAGDQGMSLWLNLGNLTFEDVSDRSQLPPADFAVTAMTAVDFDRDMDLDLILAGPKPGMLENLRYGRTRFRELPREFEPLQNGTRLFATELDGNGSWDLVATSIFGVGAVQTAMSPAGSVTPKSSQTLQQTWTDAVVCDFDNDGLLDCLAVSAAGLMGLRGDATGAWSEKSAVVTGDPTQATQATRIVVGDWDGDRDLDVVIAGEEGLSTFRNEGGSAHHVLEIAIRAQQNKGADPTASGRVNHFGVGSLIEAKSAGRYQAAVVSGQVTRFGLGKLAGADVLRVVWTNGIPRNLVSPKADEFICEEQKLEGSCPYLYTWDGEQFVFHTDLLWAAPIGLKFGETVVAPWREWEYLKIDGERLKPRDGRYEVRMTEELWEAAYFDEVKLYAVAHPADVQIHTNEKVGPPALAERAIHTARHPRLPISACDPTGRDQLPLIRERDDLYAKTWQTKFKQGLTNRHWVELNLGEIGAPKRVLLFLTGWMYPTDTAINVSLSQNPDLPEPQPPSLWAPDGKGDWREVRPYMGFPGGKTKTIVVDITDALTPGDSRLRIATNMEFYWDEIFFTVDEEPAPYREIELPLISAELRSRGGISATIVHPQFGPDRYDYQRVLPGEHWAPVDGCLTRFGDVLELLRERDDRHVIFAAGDEMALSFETLKEPLPEGWVVDFVIYNVGWDKDFNMNTVYGQTVEPLPFQAMTDYAHRNGKERRRDAAYRDYLLRYQTREQARGPFWEQIRDWKRP